MTDPKTHNPFTCLDVACPACHGLDPDLCACGHDGYDGHDMREATPRCLTPGCLCGQIMAIQYNSATGRVEIVPADR